MYLDLNTYANNQFNQLMNYEFVNPATLPWAYNALGVVVQWQPVNWFYAMFASSANNTVYGASPVQGISSDDWTNTFELGLIGEDVLGLGPGTLRVLPFFGTSKGETGAGIAINLEQKLSKSAPLGMFMRAGFTNDALGAVQGGKVWAGAKRAGHGGALADGRKGDKGALGPPVAAARIYGADG